MKNERSQSGQTGHETGKIGPERGLVNKYLEHQHLADVLGQKIVVNARNLGLEFNVFASTNLTDSSSSIDRKHMHPRSKDSLSEGMPRKYTATHKSLWSNVNGDTREIVYKKYMEANRVKSETIEISNPNSTSEMHLYLNLTNIYFELHDEGTFQVLALVPQFNNNEKEAIIVPQITRNSVRRDKKFPDLLDEFTDELRLLRSMTRLSSNSAF